MLKKLYHWVRGKVAGLSELRDKPHAVALGMACGIFFGFIPLFGFKTLLAMGTARVLRGNVVAAAVAVTLHDVILPLAPMLLRWEYQLGYWLLSHPHHLPPEFHALHHGASIWFHWATLFSVGLPLLVGSIVVAIPFAALGYGISLFLLQRSAAKKAGIDGFVQ